MTTFRYRAIQANGAPVEGVVDAADRRAALQLLGSRGLFPSQLVPAGGSGNQGAATVPANGAGSGNGGKPEGRGAAGKQGAGEAKADEAAEAPLLGGGRVRRKDITAFTRELSALLGAAIPIPQALDGLGEEEDNPAMRQVVLGLAESVRKGLSLSTAMEQHGKLFPPLYVSMVRVGEEAGALPKVLDDLANLLEHEDEVRGEVLGAVAYPAFVLGFGILTVIALLTLVLPKLFGMLQDMLPSLPIPTLILLKTSQLIREDWLWLILGGAGAAFGLQRFLASDRGAEAWDGLRLKLPVLGPVFRAAALGRFARTLGTLAHAGVSLLPALRIVEDTIGNRVLARQVAKVAEETRGGDSLAAPLRKLALFPKGVIQMIEVGEETGRLDEMLLKIATIEERHMRSRTKTLVSLLAPVLILLVGLLVGFMVIAILVPIFRMSRAIH